MTMRRMQPQMSAVELLSYFTCLDSSSRLSPPPFLKLKLPKRDEMLTDPQHITEPDWESAIEKSLPPLTAAMSLIAAAGTESTPLVLVPHTTTRPEPSTPVGAHWVGANAAVGSAA
jgi:hypothetical protein